MFANMNQNKISDAFAFAAEQYGDRMAAGTDKKLIIRASELLQLVNQVSNRTDLLVAAVLYDILVETDVSSDELALRFGQEVTRLVGVHDEETDVPWIERRPINIMRLKLLGWEEKILLIADITSRIRWINKSIQTIGESFWDFLNTPKKALSIYYSDLQDCMPELRDDSIAQPLVKQMINEYKDVFIQFWIDEGWEVIYQISDFGDCAKWRRDWLGWIPSDVPDTSGMQRMTRDEAEFMTRLWEHILTFSADLGPLQ